MTNLGGILSTWIFTNPPRYTKACIINLVFSLGVVLVAVLNMAYLARQNAEKKRAREGLVEPESESERKRLGDRHREYVYTL